MRGLWAFPREGARAGCRARARSRKSCNARVNFPPKYQDSPRIALHRRPLPMLRYRTPTTPIAGMRHVVASIDDRPRHSGGGCTINKQTPRPAAGFGGGPGPAVERRRHNALHRSDHRSTAMLRPRRRRQDRQLHGDHPVGHDQAIRLNPNYAEFFNNRVRTTRCTTGTRAGEGVNTNTR